MKKYWSFSKPLFLFFVLFCFVLLNVEPCLAATAFKSGYVTLKNGRLSVRSKLNTTITDGGVQAVINSTYDPNVQNSDIDSKNLFPYDAVCFNNPQSNGCVNSTTYTISNKLSDNLTFNMSSGVTGGATAGNMIVATQSGQIVVTFVPNQQVPVGGRVRVILPYSSGIASGTASDGIPDADGFDSNLLDGNFTNCDGNDYCGITGGTSNPSITSSALDVGNTNTKKFTLDFVVGTVNLDVGQTYNLTIGNTGNALFINPAPSYLGVGGTHVRGTADSYSIAIETYNGSAVLLDSASMKIVSNDGVQVSVTIPLLLDYTIAGITTGTAPCYSGDTGTTMLNSTTATDASYGSGANASNVFYTVGQKHTVSTNAPNGYTLAVYASGDSTNGVMYDGAGSASTDYIPHTSCDASGCATANTWAAWATSTNNGFGISTEERANVWTRFGVGQSNSFNVRTRTTTTSSDTTNTCYKLSFSGTQGAGYYSGTLYYIATPRF